jgi:hypothetical protein
LGHKLTKGRPNPELHLRQVTNVVVFSLKGWDNIAQGNALGLMAV